MLLKQIWFVYYKLYKNWISFGLESRNIQEKIMV